MADLACGTQIVYVPDHINDPKAYGYPNGAQPGFVVSGSDEKGYFCRYWRIDSGKLVFTLRTQANSELTPARNLLVAQTAPTWLVESILEILVQP